MCAVIDTCCTNPVFMEDVEGHDHFVPLLEWITEGAGRMVYGGTKYKTELGKSRREVIRIVGVLRRGGRAIEVDQARVDRIETEVTKKISNAKFNDQHLVAIIAISGCRIICTNDEKAMPYLQDRALYQPYDATPPKIYRYKQHAHMCCPDNIVKGCREGMR